MSILLKRASLIVRPGCLEIGRTLLTLNDVQDIDVHERRQGESFIWAMYASLSALALLQAAAAANLTLAILAAALALFSHVAWQRRNGESTFEIVLKKGTEDVKVFQTPCRKEAWLMRDAVAMAMPRYTA